MAQRAAAFLNEGNVDEYLIAIFFMSRHEEVIHRPSRRETVSASILRSHSHHDGSRAFLRYLKARLSHRKPASDVIKHSQRGLIRSALLHTGELLSNENVEGSDPIRAHTLSESSIA